MRRMIMQILIFVAICLIRIAGWNYFSYQHPWKKRKLVEVELDRHTMWKRARAAVNGEKITLN